MSGRLRILHAIHDFLPRHQAGSEIYAAELCSELARRGHHITVLAASYDPSRRQGELLWRVHNGLPVIEVINNWIFDSFEDTYRAAGLVPALGHVLAATIPDVLHVHNLLNLSFDLPALAKGRGIPVVGTLHDYTLVCPSGGQRLHRAEEHVCHVIEPDRCARCFRQSSFHSQFAFGRALGRPGGSMVQSLARTVRRRWPRAANAIAGAVSKAPGLEGPSPEDIERRLTAAREAAAHFDVLVAPSPSLAREFNALGFGGTRLRTADYGFSPMPAFTRRVTRSGALRVGFVGTLVWHKGVHVLVDAIGQIESGLVDVRIFGDTATFPSYVAELRRAAAGLPIRFLGRFERGNVAAIYAELDVLVVPSLWLENSPLVIHEAFMAGVPVVGARIGGIADLVTDGVNGLLYPPESSAALADALTALARDRRRLEALAAVRSPVTSLADDAGHWEQTYLSLVDRAARSGLS
jgi:glycosyltransferase involved in cell wall biosynthesis